MATYWQDHIGRSGRTGRGHRPQYPSSPPPPTPVKSRPQPLPPPRQSRLGWLVRGVFGFVFGAVGGDLVADRIREYCGPGLCSNGLLRWLSDTSNVWFLLACLFVVAITYLFFSRSYGPLRLLGWVSLVGLGMGIFWRFSGMPEQFVGQRPGSQISTCLVLSGLMLSILLALLALRRHEQRGRRR